jgi:4-amino-4-deoxy-L-arabinose transferase-like glycosyltransferase
MRPTGPDGAIFRLSRIDAHPYALAVLALVLCTAPLGVRSRALWVGDETRDAAIANGMARSGDFLHPKLAGRGVPEKPFFFYAVVAASYRLADSVTPTSTRLPAVVFSAVTLLATAGTARRLFSARAGFFAAVILSTTYLFVVNAHDCVVDVALAAFVGLGLLAFVDATQRSGAPSWNSMFGASAAAALLVKGFVGPALLLAVTLPLAVLRFREGRPSLRVSWSSWFLPLGALLFWIGMIYGEGGSSALKDTLWTHQFGRLAGFRGEEFSHHRAPFYFYLAAIPGILFPWSITLPAALARSLRRRSSEPTRWLSLALLLAVGLLSVAGTKRTVYLLPVVPIASILVGRFLDENLSEGLGPVPRGAWLQACVIGLASSAVPLVPALADGRLTLPEAAVSAAVALVSLTLFVSCGRSQRRLVAASLALAMGSLLLLDRYALPQLRRDEPTREFFARVKRHVNGSTKIYSYNLNEDVLGRACLELPAQPRAEENLARILDDLGPNPGLVLVEVEKLRSRRELPKQLRQIEVGTVGTRTVGLFGVGA